MTRGCLQVLVILKERLLDLQLVVVRYLRTPEKYFETVRDYLQVVVKLKVHSQESKMAPPLESYWREKNFLGSSLLAQAVVLEK